MHVDKRGEESYYPDAMVNPGNRRPEESLLGLRNWAKNAASEFVRNDELDKAQLSLDILELSRQIENKLEKLYQGSDLYHETDPAPERESKEEVTGYPTFFIKGDFLVKQGRTRDRRDIYEQKLAKVEFDRIIDAIREIAQNKKEFDIRDVLSAIQVPNYQAYLILGVLQTLGMIQVPRRGMYSFVDQKRFIPESSSAWQKLSANFAERR